MQSRVAEQSNGRVRSKRQGEEKLAKHFESNEAEGVDCKLQASQSDSISALKSIKMQTICKEDLVKASRP